MKTPEGMPGWQTESSGRWAVFAESEALMWAEGVRKKVGEGSQRRQELRWQGQPQRGRAAFTPGKERMGAKKSFPV